MVLLTLSVRSLIVNSFPPSNFNLGTHYPTNNVLMIWPLTGSGMSMGDTYYLCCFILHFFVFYSFIIYCLLLLEVFCF